MQDIPQVLIDAYRIVNLMCEYFYDIKSSILSLHDVIHINKYTTDEDIQVNHLLIIYIKQNFFVMMCIYGSGLEINKINPAIFNHSDNLKFASVIIHNLTIVLIGLASLFLKIVLILTQQIKLIKGFKHRA